MAEPMTGPSVRTHIPARKLAGGIRGSIITPVRLVLISGKGTVGKATVVSLLTAFSNVGSTQLVIGPNYVKMDQVVSVRFVSLLIV